MFDNFIENANKFLSRLFGSRNQRILRTLHPLVEHIRGLEPEYQKLTDAQLRAKTAEFKERLAKGKTLDDLLPEAFALVREASCRTTKLRHFDVQMLGGITLHRGMISEMATGEGKTLVATSPAYLNALSGKGVHIVTVNDYLAKRDCQWMGPIYHLLGLTLGTIQHEESFLFDPTYKDDLADKMHHLRPCLRKEAYAADITYGTNNEFGFDYLRDNMKTHLEEQVQRELNYAIIDEADNILIDEARTPLIIAGPSEENPEKYNLATRICAKLGKGHEDQETKEQTGDYIVREKEHQVILTDEGIEHAEQIVGLGSFYEGANMDWPHLLEQGLRSKELYRRDKDYVVKDGEVIIVDEFTGRLMPGRRWSDGLHQAIEAKEHLPIKAENQTLATITLQNLFRLYGKISGMTGTASTEAMELDSVYKLEVVTIPTHRAMVRATYPDVVFRTSREKFDAVAEEIMRVNATARPILVGTTSIENSERISELLIRRGVQHDVLNAKHHEREASIVAKAGQLGSVTIATNMAGRGTDILLGTFTKEQLLEHWKAHDFVPRDLSLDLAPADLDRRLGEHWQEQFLTPEEKALDPEKRKKKLAEYWDLTRTPVPKVCERVADLGGLHILGTERHEARRIDNQLRGRAGRQGDPGSSQFVVSLEDDLLRIFAPEWVSHILEKLGMTEGQPIESPMVSRAIEKAQKKMEAHNFDIRKNLLDYDGVMNEQRKIIYSQRQDILKGANLKEMILKMVDERLATAIDLYLPPKEEGEWDYKGLADWANRKFGLAVKEEETSGKKAEELEDLLRDKVHVAYQAKEKELDEAKMRFTERVLLLDSIDDKWKDHLYNMEHLRAGIGLRGFGQVDPKIEYKKEGYDLFQSMLEAIQEEVTDRIFKIRVEKRSEDELAKRWQPTDFIKPTAAPAPPTPVASAAGGGGDGGENGEEGGRGPAQPREKPKPIVSGDRIGRNDPCVCGSGKKYKKCCGRV
ncbi:MAG: preprotein translocase subunit SecA [Planctomycetes bacterium]|nr:preprotein translocase subunit SecA [Planctomycetota bacterium]